MLVLTATTRENMGCESCRQNDTLRMQKDGVVLLTRPESRCRDFRAPLVKANHGCLRYSRLTAALLPRRERPAQTARRAAEPRAGNSPISDNTTSFNSVVGYIRGKRA